jgi:hypothetical protein
VAATRASRGMACDRGQAVAAIRGHKRGEDRAGDGDNRKGVRGVKMV